MTEKGKDWRFWVGNVSIGGRLKACESRKDWKESDGKGDEDAEGGFDLVCKCKAGEG